MSILHNDWANMLHDEFQKPYYVQLRAFLKEEYKTQTVYPTMHDIFNALHYTSYEETKVVILGQDPYHGPNQAHGLSFSVKPGVRLPPSLQNIFKELRDDLGYEIPNHGHLTTWANQGVLLLNTGLTVRKGQAASHRGKGWEHFTDRIISCLNKRKKPVIFVLWGRHAQEKQALITSKQHHIITAPHPSPFSANRGFFGSRPFSKMNDILTRLGEAPIEWQVPNL
ncbi:uracil-DNA glycosylase [Shouchella lonarensis]|uniref:Uracil-DNA glycosylase n=1 Tax=Shouchella lonarensis TaxID=1464122 RepID=A0A1G6HBE3_9BACI|nr:uracil-DNA glycosylase [Shouchella lonarensis]SDB91408.1 Uracil-DNA glycosylase [Shouchella lonarensis]